MKVTLINTREHAIHLNIGTETVVVPSSKQNPDDRKEIINGTVEIDDSLLVRAKKNPVIASYFKDGWLTTDK